jgi:His-Xaa-Ser system protein HxsD
MSNEAILNFPSSLYEAEAIQKSAYKLLNLFTIDLQSSSEVLNCKLTSNNGVSDELFAHAVEEFKKEVLDQQLRLKLKAETESVRNLILGIAFSNTGLQGSE